MLQSDASKTSSLWRRLFEQHAAAIQLNSDAIQHVRRGEFAEAVKLWSHLCSQTLQHPPSLFNLAVCYEQGIGVDKDIDKVISMTVCYHLVDGELVYLHVDVRAF